MTTLRARRYAGRMKTITLRIPEEVWSTYLDHLARRDALLPSNASDSLKAGFAIEIVNRKFDEAEDFAPRKRAK